MKDEPLTYGDLDKEQIKAVRDALDAFISRISDESAICAEAVAAIAFYRLQRHPRWGRNATTTQKNASYEYWKGICHRCRKEVDRAETKFHHLIRGIPNQHDPSNLVPEHTACHDHEHNVLHGSLSKGSPQPKQHKNCNQ